MTKIEPPNTPAPERDGAAAAVVADTAGGHADADIDVVTVGTFAAGQSEQGRYVVAAEAPQGSFAEGHPQEEPIEAPTEAHTKNGA